MSKYGPLLFDGQNGINSDGIRLILEIEEVEDKASVTHKLVTYLSAIIKTQRKK